MLFSRDMLLQPCLKLQLDKIFFFFSNFIYLNLDF